MSTRTIASKQLVRDLSDRSRVIATLEIVHREGNQYPYFAATCHIYEAHGTWSGAARQRNGKDIDGGGAAHETILRAFPNVAPFIAMHLSEYPSGVPMYAEANALYFASDAHLDYELRTYGQEYVERHGTGRDLAASILRCEVDDLPEAVWTHRQWSEFIDSQRERWAREAKEAFDLLDSIEEQAS